MTTCIIKGEQITEETIWGTVALLPMNDESQQWWVTEDGKIIKRFFKVISKRWEWDDKILEYKHSREHKILGQYRVNFTKPKIIASAWIPTNTEYTLYAKIIDNNKPVTKENVLWSDSSKAFSPAVSYKIYQETEQYELEGEEFRVPVFLKTDKQSLNVLDEYDPQKHITKGESCELSNFGRIRKKGKYHIGVGGKMGYLVMSLGSMGSFAVHTVVIQTFPENNGGPRPFKNASVDHIDRNHRNNKRDNLRWASPVVQAANRNVCFENDINKIKISGGNEPYNNVMIQETPQPIPETIDYIKIIDEHNIKGQIKEDFIHFLNGKNPEEIRNMRGCGISAVTTNIFKALEKIPFNKIKNNHWEKFHITEDNIENLKTLIQNNTMVLESRATDVKVFLDENLGKSDDEEHNWTRARFVKLFVNKYKKEII